MSDLIERIPEGFTPGPWKWWTSNSWRRLKRDDWGISQSVAEPYVCRDGHPDLTISQEDMALIALAPELAAGYRAQAARIAEMEAEVARKDALLRRAADFLEGMNPAHRSNGHRNRDLREAIIVALAAPDTGGADGE